MAEEKYVCPRCRSHLIWVNNGSIGQRTKIICGNNPVASRIDFRPHEARFCFWTGICEKGKDGKIFLKDIDGTHLRKTLIH